MVEMHYISVSYNPPITQQSISRTRYSRSLVHLAILCYEKIMSTI